MEIIKNWLTYKLGLQIPESDDAAEFDKGLSNCVLIAEVLRKYGVLSDDEFISLKHDNSEKTKLSNIGHIVHWLTGSGIKINDSDLHDIAMEKGGVGMRVLYELYLWFEYGPRAPKIPGENQTGYEFGKHPNDQQKFGASEHEQPKQGPKLYEELRKKEEKSQQLGKIYKSYDRVEFSRKEVLGNPFLESSESAQAQHLYFCSRTLEVLKKQEVERTDFARIRAIRLKEIEKYAKALASQCFIEASDADNIDLLSIQARQEEKIGADRREKIRGVWDEMDKFDWAVTETCESDIPVYSDGRGDACEYEFKMQFLRCRRETANRDELVSSIMRKQILNCFTQKTPFKMLRALEGEVMKGLCELPVSERLFASYVRHCNAEKDHFIQHSIYEARQVQDAFMEDLQKELEMEEEEADLSDYMVSEEANPHKSFDYVCRLLEEPELIQKLTMADGTIQDMLDRALQTKQDPPPPPPPCTPTFIRRKRCRELTRKAMGRIMVCEDELVGEGGDGLSICRVVTRPKLNEGG